MLGVPQGVADEIRADVCAAGGRSSCPSARPRSEPTPASAPLRRSRRRGWRSTARPSRISWRQASGSSRPIPGTDQDGAPRFAAVSGSSASAAVVAGAAALLAEARPDLDAAALKAALCRRRRCPPGADRGAPGLVDVAAAAGTEVVVDPPSLALRRPARGRQSGQRRRDGAKRLAARACEITLDPGRAQDRARASRSLPDTLVLAPGQSASVGVFGRVPTLPAAPGGLSGALRVVPRFAAPFRVRWAIALPVQDKPLLTVAAPLPDDLRPLRREPGRAQHRRRAGSTARSGRRS